MTTDITTMEDTPVETFISILSLTSDEVKAISQDEDQPYIMRKLISLVTSDNEAVALNTIKWITEQIELQKSKLPKTISEQITTYGELSYTMDDIIALHPESAVLIKSDWKTKKGLYLAYNKGVALGKYKIDAQLQEKASKGDIKAIEMINIRKMLK